ncbi:MAG: Cell division protein FtsX [Hydrocarboniphaga sp.]|uniref:permease-like cell division protein FtsX n=1 Tax=Hydrocarboniphaga sp. TaxID=2033016 RepID=UPI002637BD53|nr:permease-like cell division protein FtsX [Hydrocarboniphaga sp.]MDB5969278.1 Cell division protein FtsX [Hydrocarboniphaga sp.]
MARTKAQNAADAAPQNWLARTLQEHARVFFFSLGKLVNHPGSSLLTAAVIGIALALPAALHLAVNNFQRLAYTWQNDLQLSLFLKDGVDETRGRELTQQLASRDGVKSARYISREQSAAEFRELSGFGEVLDLLQHNPLPAVIVVSPDAGRSAAQVTVLAQTLSALPEVELSQMDQQWLQRLQSLLAILERVVMMAAALLGVAVLVIVGNTLRLDIEARRDEIVVMKLIGAPDGFIRRPFLYGGCWLGLLGGWFALLLLTVGLAVLQAPAHELAALYQSDFAIQGPGLATVLTIILGGVLLGLIGAWWTVTRHLAAIEPA